MVMIGTWAQFEDGERRATRQVTTVTGLNEELLVDSQQGREAQTSSGGRRVGALSRWMVSPRPGELGGISGYKDIYRIIVNRWNTGGR